MEHRLCIPGILGLCLALLAMPCAAAGAPTGGGSSNGGDATHLQNFLDAIRGSAKLNAEIEEGYKSVLLCHLGNISYRLGRAIRLDPATHQIAGDKEASALWSREYRPGWEPQLD